MKEKLQNPPIMGMVLIIIIMMLTLLIKTGAETLNRETIEKYINNNDFVLTEEIERQLEEFLNTRGVSKKVLDNIKESEPLKKEINGIILNTYDYYRNKKEINYSKENLITIIESEVKEYEKTSNEEVWKKVGPEIVSSINNIMNEYEYKLVPLFKIIFMILTPIVWIILLSIILVIISIMYIFKKIWSLFYSSIAILLAYLVNAYILVYSKNLYTIGNFIIPEEFFEPLKTKAEYNNKLILVLSIVIMSMFLTIQIIKRINRVRKIRKYSKNI